MSSGHIRSLIAGQKGKIPFSMTNGVEVMILLEIRFPTLRTSLFTLDNNDNLLEKSLDLVEERRENAMV